MRKVAVIGAGAPGLTARVTHWNSIHARTVRHWLVKRAA